MSNDRSTPTGKKLRADGGSPIARVFELTGADRISDLTWVVDSDGQLYALEVDQDSLLPVTAQAEEYISTAVAINVRDEIVREIDTDELAVENLSRVDNALGGAQRTD